MPFTPVYGWPYQALANTPDGPHLGADLALAIEASLAATDATAAAQATSLAAVVAESAGTAPIATAWTAWSPTWGAASGNPVLGNGTNLGRYKIVGKLCFMHFTIVMGSTTTFGTGVYGWSFPPGVTAKATAAGGATMSFGFRDNSAATHTMGFSNYTDGATTFDCRVSGANQASSTIPYTWAVSDFIRCWGFVELQ